MRELAGMLKTRQYNMNIVEAALKKAQAVGREKALERAEKKKN